MKVLLLRDQKPGHYNQSEGVLLALKTQFDIEVERLEVPERWLMPGRFQRWLVGRDWLPLKFLEFICGARSLLPVDPPDLIISAGGVTLPFNRLLARRYQCHNIFSGSVRNIDVNQFSLILHIYRRYKGQDGYLVTLKPAPVDLDGLISYSSRFVRYNALLIGGPTVGAAFTGDDWEKLLKRLQVDESQNWVITTSRRTPENWRQDLTNLQNAQGDRIELIDYMKCGPGDALRIAAGAESVFVSSDSDSMISEAVACCKPTVSLNPPVMTQSEDTRSYMQWLESKGWLRSITVDEFLTVDFTELLKMIYPIQEPPLEKLGSMIVDKLPQLSISDGFSSSS